MDGMRSGWMAAGIAGLLVLHAGAETDALSASPRGFEAAASGLILPSPDIRANGADEPIAIAVSDPLTLAISLDSGGYFGYAVDGWLLADTPAGAFYYDKTSGLWKAGSSATYSGRLPNIPATVVYQGNPTLPGVYRFYFGVDSQMDGILQTHLLVYDTVEVDVRERPTADANGPYAIDEGQNLPLDGSGSSDPRGDPLTYAWDLDGDGEYGDASGATPTVPWASLAGLASDGTPLPVSLRVFAAPGVEATHDTTLTIRNLAPVAQGGGPYSIAVGGSVALAGSATDAGGDPLTYAWDLDGDGTFGDAAGAAPSVPWSALEALGLALGGSPYTVTLRVDDGQGGVTTAAAVLHVVGVDVKANGVDGPINVFTNDLAEVTVEVYAGPYAGAPADWWCLAYWHEQNAWYSWVAPYTPLSWAPWTLSGPPSAQAPLADSPPITVLSITGAPVGHWTFYAGVDATPNTKLDLDVLVYDSVEVTVAP